MNSDKKQDLQRMILFAEIFTDIKRFSFVDLHQDM